MQPFHPARHEFRVYCRRRDHRLRASPFATAHSSCGEDMATPRVSSPSNTSCLRAHSLEKRTPEMSQSKQRCDLRVHKRLHAKPRRWNERVKRSNCRELVSINPENVLTTAVLSALDARAFSSCFYNDVERNNSLGRQPLYTPRNYKGHSAVIHHFTSI